MPPEVSDMTVNALPHNAVVVFRREDDSDSTDAAAQEFSEAMRHLDRKDVLIVVLTQDQTIDILDQDQMRQHGWVRQAEE